MLAVAGALAAAPNIAAACAGCRNPNLPVLRPATAYLGSGALRAAALLTGTAINVVHEAGCASLSDCAEAPVQPLHHHDQNIYPGELRAIAELGLGSWWGLEGHLPFRLTHTTVRYTTPEGALFQPLDAGVHHRNETLAGLGDAWLLARVSGIVAGVLVAGRVGLSLPLGRTEEDPFALGALGRRHQHIQFGTGTFDPLVAFDAARSLGGFELAAYAQAQASLYANAHGFRAGPRSSVGVQAARRAFGRSLVGVGFDLLHEGAERWSGRIQQDGNLGRTEVLAGLAFSHPFGATLLSVTARVPLARWIVADGVPPGRLSSPLLLSVSASRTFGPGR